jgi:hypothetical protein
MSTTMPAALSTILTEPAKLQDFLRSCGANDVGYYPAVHPDCDKPYGAVRLTMSLRSLREFINLRHFVSMRTLRLWHMQCYCFDGVMVLQHYVLKSATGQGF